MPVAPPRGPRRPSETSPACVQAPSPPLDPRHAFGIRSHEQSVTSEPSSGLLPRASVLPVRALHPSIPPPSNLATVSDTCGRFVTPTPRSCFQRADESTLPLERFTGVVRAGERKPPAASDEEHREPCQP